MTVMVWKRGIFLYDFACRLGMAFGNDDVATNAYDMYHHLMAITAI